MRKSLVPGVFKKEMNAVYTVEAAFIFPIMIFVILALLWLFFFMYARIKLEADVDMEAREISRTVAAKDDREEDMITEDLLKKAISGYPYYHYSNGSISTENGKIKVNASLIRNTEYGFLYEMTGNIDVSGEWYHWDNPRIKRIISVIAEKAGKEE